MTTAYSTGFPHKGFVADALSSRNATELKSLDVGDQVHIQPVVLDDYLVPVLAQLPKARLVSKLSCHQQMLTDCVFGGRIHCLFFHHRLEGQLDLGSQ